MQADMVNFANPWRELPGSEPFVLACDRGPIEQYHASTPPASHRLHLELLPEPFLGRPDAPVVLLNLNPGFNSEDILAHRRPDFAEAARLTLFHAPQQYPFYLLDPRFCESSGARWWRTHLRQLIYRYGEDRIANAVACVEYFGYHSEHYGFPIVLPSQTYSFDLVTAALDTGAVVVILRAWTAWVDAVPQLASYPRAYRLRNRQRVWLTQNNCPDGWQAITGAIEGFE